MVNRNSKGHGTKRNRANRPRRKESVRTRRAAARVRAEERNKKLQDALAAGN